jgi:ribokinase
LPDSLYPEVTHLILNETETAILSGRPQNSVSVSSDLDTIAAEFIEKGVAYFVVTLGKDGVFYQTVTRSRKKQPGKRVPAIKTRVVDTTAAGDTFVGAYAVHIASAMSKSALDDGETIDEAVAFATRAAGKTVEKEGAQKSIPWLDEVSQA